MARGRPAARDEAVSAVIGTVLVLGISVAGIGAVLFWGAPLIQEMQDRNAEASITSDFLQVRQASGRLTGIDSSRSVGINVPSGTLDMDQATHLVVSTSRESGCTTDLDDWTDGDGTLMLELSAGCSEPAGVNTPSIAPLPPSTVSAYIYRLEAGGATSVPITVSLSPLTIAADPIDIETYDWLMEIRDSSNNILQQHWILRSDVLTWQHRSTGSDRSVHYAWGPVVVERDAALFAEGQYFATEDAFQRGDFYLRLNALRATGSTLQIEDPGSRGLLLALSSMVERTDGALSTHQVRFETDGAQDEAFCNTFGLRNILRPDDPLYDPDPCAAEAADGSWGTDYQPPSTPFRFEFLHATVTADIQL